jgi:hypothetical protein
LRFDMPEPWIYDETEDASRVDVLSTPIAAIATLVTFFHRHIYDYSAQHSLILILTDTQPVKARDHCQHQLDKTKLDPALSLRR